jgi:Anti-sigma-K factor rskA
VSAVGGRQRYDERHPGDDLALYALDGLERDELRDIEDHLAQCGSCRRELAAHEEALAALIEDGPPPGLWDAVQAQIRDADAGPVAHAGPLFGDFSSADAGPVAGNGTAPRDTGGPGPSPAPIDDLARRRSMRRRLALLAAAAAVVALAGVGVGARLGDGGGGSTTLAGGSVDGPTIAVLTDDDGAEVAHVVAGADGDVLVLEDLPELRREDRAFQVWSVDGTQAVSLGMLGDGSVDAVPVRLPVAASELAISEEPAQGSLRPTGRIVASGPVVRPV